MPWRAPLAALGGAFLGALLGAGVAWMAVPPPVRPLDAGDERLNVVRLPGNMLAKTVNADEAIDELLTLFIASTPAISYARVSIVHNGTMAMENIHLLHFSTIASVAAPGWPAMPMPQNHPLSEVRDYVVPVYASPTCVVIKTTDLGDARTRERLLAARVGAVIDCSIFSPRGSFLGMFYADFASVADLPADIRPIEAREQTAAVAIGRVLVSAR